MDRVHRYVGCTYSPRTCQNSVFTSKMLLWLRFFSFFLFLLHNLSAKFSGSLSLLNWLRVFFPDEIKNYKACECKGNQEDIFFSDEEVMEL